MEAAGEEDGGVFCFQVLVEFSDKGFVAFEGVGVEGGEAFREISNRY